MCAIEYDSDNVFSDNPLCCSDFITFPKFYMSSPIYILYLQQKCGLESPTMCGHVSLLYFHSTRVFEYIKNPIFLLCLLFLSPLVYCIRADGEFSLEYWQVQLSTLLFLLIFFFEILNSF